MVMTWLGKASGNKTLCESQLNIKGTGHEKANIKCKSVIGHKF